MSGESIPLSKTLASGVPATVLALHCGEPGVPGAVEELLQHIAPGEGVERVAAPGGVWWLARAAGLTEGRLKRFALAGRKPVREVLDALVSGSSLRRVVLIGHQDCTWYRRRSPGLSPGDLVRQQGNDMFRARDEIARWSPRALDLSAWIILSSEQSSTARRLF